MASKFGVCHPTTFQERQEERAHRILTRIAGGTLAVCIPVLLYAVATGLFPV